MPSLEEIEKRRQQNKKGFQRKKRRPWDLTGEGLEPPEMVIEKVIEKVTSSATEKVTEQLSKDVEQPQQTQKQLEITQKQLEAYEIEDQKPEIANKPRQEAQPLQTINELLSEEPVRPANTSITQLVIPTPQQAPATQQFTNASKPVLAVEYRVRMLRGLKKKLLKIIVNSCLENSTFITPPLFMEDLIQMTGKNKVILKARLSDLKATGLVIAHSRRGVGGYYQFEIDQEVINAVKKYL